MTWYGHVLAHEHVLQHPRLRVRPVEDRDLARREPLVDQPRDLGGDEAGLRVLVLELDDPHRVALAQLGEEVLRLALGVLLDDRVGGSQDRVRGAVVLLERDDVRSGEVRLELGDVADVCPAEPVHRLILISDRADVSVLGAEELQQAVLRVVRVLVLVDEDVAEGLLPVGQRLGEALEDLHGEHEHVVEVDGVRCVQPALVQLVHLRDRLVPEGGDAREVVLRRDELVLRARDLRVDAARREALRVLPELLEAGLDEPHLVLVVVDRERRAVAEPLRFTSEHAPAGGVEGQDPDRARGGAEHPLEALAHLPGRLVRERDREDLARLDLQVLDEVGDAVRQDAGLSRARAGDHEQRPLGVLNGLALGLIEGCELGLGLRDGHAPMLAAAAVTGE